MVIMTEEKPRSEISSHNFYRYQSGGIMTGIQLIKANKNHIFHDIAKLMGGMRHHFPL
tara:strand:+ start:22695 stop:22868 length:174 start_codon:yes stop_codon:yes gene_type:complete